VKEYQNEELSSRENYEGGGSGEHACAHWSLNAPTALLRKKENIRGPFSAEGDIWG